MRPPFATCSALVLGAALHGAGLTADDGAFRPVAGPGSDLPVMVSQQAAEAFAAPPASSTGFGPVINAGMTHDAAAPQTPPPTQGQALQQCSIVGAVNAPGTYAGEHPSVLLRSLIEQAGGLTEQAAGTVRILHDGRQQIINDIATAEAVVVPSESVIVVDARNAGPHAAAGDSRLYTDVACLQLCDRPAVLCLDPATATVPKLLAMLGQPAELAATVRIISPHDQYPTSGTLSSGSVVIFDPQALINVPAEVFQRWPLNDLIHIENPDHQQVAAETIDLLQFLESRMQPAVDAEVAPVDSVITSPQPPAALLAPSPELENSATVRTASTAPATLSETFDPFPSETLEPENDGVRPASAVQLRSVGSPPVLPTQTADMPAQDVVDSTFDSAEADFEPLSASDEVLPSSDSDPRSQWLQFGSSVTAWLLCGLAAWGVFNIWMRQHERRRRATLQRDAAAATAKSTISLPSRSALSQVIDNSLPFRVEETPTPSQAFHGRTVGFRYLIRSGPHPLQGPHFATSRVQPTTPAAAAVTAGREVPPRTTARAPVAAGRSINRFDTAEVAETNVTERVPAATERSAARGVSPLERALRSILREGRDHAQ
jgi:hypothetical protein